MSEELVTEAPVEVPAAEPIKTEATTDNKPAGYHPVDPREATPEQVQERLDYLYRQAKQTKRMEREMGKLEKIAADQSRLIEELSSGMNTVVGHLQEKQITESESQLKDQMKAALDSGDTKAYVDAQDKLFDVKARKASAPQKTETQKQAYGGERLSPKQAVDHSLDNGDLTSQDATYIKSWMDEKDERGRQYRPWVSENDPEYEAAVSETKSVFTNPRFANLSMDQKLAEVDRRMGFTKPSAGQTVMGGNLTTRAKTSKVTLTPKQQEIAVKTRYGGSKAKSDAEHIEAYRKQIEKVQAMRGAR